MKKLPLDLYVTGTDTGIGKTFVTCALLRQASEAGQRLVGMKPVASGCIETGQGWRSEDALALQQADGLEVPYLLRNPYALPLPAAPEIAAAEVGVDIALAPLQHAHARLRAGHEGVLVEGVGGWAAPLSRTLEQADLVRALDIPVLMVVGLRLGCVHQARVTQRAIVADGCRFAGWIANPVEPAMLRQAENMAILSRVLGAPPLQIMPWRA
ncbi:dethiobiotin synthase [Lysobacteraceae bacterium NML75-0749]|nr:dethiobiotin synthase [Xanthomonadaceae bacterium NML75-0749]PJK03700.1 dethiobiotin synthase [Xanthomonadaceae bacterium NML91-0268]